MTILLRNTGFHGVGREYGEEGVFPQKNLLRKVKQNENKMTAGPYYNLSWTTLGSVGPMWAVTGIIVLCVFR